MRHEVTVVDNTVETMAGAKGVGSDCERDAYRGGCHRRQPLITGSIDGDEQPSGCGVAGIMK